MGEREGGDGRGGGEDYGRRWEGGGEAMRREDIGGNRKGGNGRERE